MPVYSWLCRTELDRERMVATVRWVGPARATMFLILLGVLVGSAHHTGWLPLIPLFVSAAVSIPLYRNLEHRKRPEFWAAGGWLSTQISLGAGIALTGGPKSPAMPWLAIAVISLIARFSRAGITAGLAFLFGELLIVTFGIDPAGVWQNPSEFLFPLGLLFSVGVFSAAQMRSDLDHRDYDKTTGLANQAKFSDDLRQAIQRRLRRGGTVTVLAIDLDGFRLANEGLGPRGGDALLRQAGSRIARAARGADLVARRSSDEFFIFLADLAGEPGAPVQPPRQRAQAVARAVQAEIAERFVVGRDEVYLDACVGISMLETGDQDPAPAAEQLLADAQSALSAGQSAGPGTLMFFDHDHSASRSQLSLISGLRRAIERQEFVMHYQPCLDLHNRQLIGVEALLRWEDPDRGLVPPGDFIPLAEETGLIETIGLWAFTDVCRQTAEWQSRGHVFDVAFNLSPRQLRQPDLLERMLKAVATTGVDPNHLVVEITESTALGDPDRAIELMCLLTRNGFRLAIDDFGVGLSSLSRLRDMPATFLKIDRSFVSDLETSPTGLVMIRTMVQLAENLGMLAHAEGIETELQLRLLRESGCGQGQGFLFSRAIPAAEVLDYDFISRQARLMPTPGQGTSTTALSRAADD
ncbi:MAG TPA: bifunctional diguanylate cyclase/phosphodiesterase [Solirubrobacteraceae bacterium]|nr:bifunctional diguanylate cyclase/phosphodiesterase [Solirubrobacteraceae bacterium]